MVLSSKIQMLINAFLSCFGLLTSYSQTTSTSLQFNSSSENQFSPLIVVPEKPNNELVDSCNNNEDGIFGLTDLRLPDPSKSAVGDKSALAAPQRYSQSNYLISSGEFFDCWNEFVIKCLPRFLLASLFGS
jgi:hypothetical protein